MFRPNHWILQRIALWSCLLSGMLIHVEGGQGGRITVFQVALCVLLGVHFVVLAGTRELELFRVELWFLAIGVAVALSYIANMDMETAVNARLREGGSSGSFEKIILAGFVALVTNFLGFHFGSHLVRTIKDATQLALVVVLGTAVSAVGNLGSWLVQTGGEISRYNFVPLFTSSFGTTAMCAEIGLFLSVGLLLGARLTPFKRSLLIANVIAQSALITVLVVRQEYLASAVGIILIVRLFRTHAAGNFRSSALAVILLILLAAVSGYLITQRAEGIAESMAEAVDSSGLSMTTRSTTWDDAWELFMESPYFGIGFGMFGARNTQPIGYIGGVPIYLANPHNGIASFASEMGMFGLVTIELFFVVLAISLWRAFRRPRKAEVSAVVIPALALFLLSFFSHTLANSSLFPYPTDTGTVQMAFIAWTLIGAALRTSLISCEATDANLVAAK